MGQMGLVSGHFLVPIKIQFPENPGTNKHRSIKSDSETGNFFLFKTNLNNQGLPAVPQTKGNKVEDKIQITK